MHPFAVFQRWFLLVTFWAFPFATLFSQSIPTDNPYRARYAHLMPPAGYHWTDSIRWNQVVNIQDYAGQVVRIKDPQTQNDEDSLNDWLPAFKAAQAALVNQGGGVLYFPPLPPRYSGPGGVEPGKDSAYFFSDHVRLKSNVILRGPTPNQTDARKNTFTPVAFFQFPKYPYNGTFNVPNSVSFKEITIDTTGGVMGKGKTGFKNIGVVYIDVDGGRFSAHPTFRDTTVGGSIYGKANERPRNVLLLGMRSNNVAIPDVNIPNAILPASKIWHRWPWLFGSNIDVYVAANCIIAGCRLNDYQNNSRNNLRRVQNASFDQAGYVPNAWSANSVPCFPNPNQARFNYNNHYGIFLNRLKKVGYNETRSFQSNSSPEMEPDLYAPGNVVMDNWVYKENFVGIQAAGNGLIIKGNVVKDLPNKETAIGPTGARCLATTFPPNNTPTYENRGIDFAGWNVLVDSNDTEVYRVKLLPSNDYSSDGEGWYFQGPSGSTARNITVSRNISRGNNDGLCYAVNNTLINKAFNGFANTVSVQNVRIFDNDFGGFPFKVKIDGSEFPNYTLQGFRMYNNRNLHSIEVYARGCGDSSFVYSNTKAANAPNCGFADLKVDCFASLNPNYSLRNENANLGFSTFPANPNGDDRSGCPNLCPSGNDPPCGFATTWIADPQMDDSVGVGQQVVITAGYSFSGTGFCTPDSLVLYKNSGVKVQALPGSGLGPGSGEGVFTNYFAPTGCETDAVYTVCFKGGYRTFSQPRLIYACVSVNPLESSKWNLSLFPNPASEKVRIRLSGPEGAESKAGVFLLDPLGRQIQAIGLDVKTGEGTLPIHGIPAGVYWVKAESSRGRIFQKLVVQ